MLITSTVTTTTTTATALAPVAAVLGLIATVFLIALLCVKELTAARAVVAGVTGTSFPEALNRFLTVAIVPLLLVFAAIVVTEVLLVWR